MHHGTTKNKTINFRWSKIDFIEGHLRLDIRIFLLVLCDTVDTLYIQGRKQRGVKYVQPSVSSLKIRQYKKLFIFTDTANYNRQTK